MRRLFFLAIVTAALLPHAGPAHGWPIDGKIVAPIPPPYGQAIPRVLVGRQGQAFVFFGDARWAVSFDVTAREDIYAQLLTPAGNVAPGWPDTGLMVARAPRTQQPTAGLSHPDGSFIVGWWDDRDPDPSLRARGFLSRVRPDGTIDPAWPRHGFLVFPASIQSSFDQMVWVAPDTLVIRTGHVATDGTYTFSMLFQQVVLGASGPSVAWGDSGRMHRWRPNRPLFTQEIIADGQGGVFVLFDEWLPPFGQPGPTETDLYVMRLGRDGLEAPGWESGAHVVTNAPGSQDLGAICPDGSGGMYVAWTDDGSGLGLDYPARYDYQDIRLLRLTADGVPAPGWPAAGMLVADEFGSEWQPQVMSDGIGGVYVAWNDNDSPVAVTRVQGDGTFVPGWTRNGIAVSDLFAAGNDIRMVPDDLGGLYLMFLNSSAGNTRLQHVLPWGTLDPVWPTSGDLASPGSDVDIVRDGAGGCYVAFGQARAPEVRDFATLIRVKRYSALGLVPVRLAESSAAATSERVHLEWRGGEASATAVRVARRDQGGADWTDLGAPRQAGRDLIVYDDATVSPGGRYVYRLVRGGAEVMSDERLVTVPLAEFALAGAWPNPALAREAMVRFTLAGGAVARLEVLDLAGRHEHVRELVGLPPGTHTVSLGQARLAPGVHWLRLTEGAREAHARIVVVK